MYQIRPAILSDLEAIRIIYNEAVTNTTATFDTEEKSYNDLLIWFKNRDENFPIIVAEHQNNVVGYAALNKWSDKKAYDITAEISLYISPLYRGKGIGKMLLQHLCFIAQNTQLTNIIARITQGNEVSIALHQKFGFEIVGVLKKCGKKFDTILDVTIMQKILK